MNRPKNVENGSKGSSIVEKDMGKWQEGFEKWIDREEGRTDFNIRSE